MNQYCGCIDRDCSVCYEMEAEYCPSFISIPTNLTPTDRYTLWVRDKFGNLYYERIIIDSEGDAVINVDDFSPYIFSDAFGPVTVFLTVNEDGTGLTTFEINSVEYTCVTLNTSPAVFLVDECENYITDESGNYLLS